MFKLQTKVPGYGVIGAVKMGELEREYLLTDGQGTVSWLSESDIRASLLASTGYDHPIILHSCVRFKDQEHCIVCHTLHEAVTV